MLQIKPRYLLPALIGANGFFALLVSQTSEFQATSKQIRSLRAVVWSLQQKTGWHICVEEPVWDTRATAGAGVRTTFYGDQVEPPDADVLQLSVPTLRGAAAKPAALTSLLTAFNAQNNSVRYKTESLSDFTVFEADTVRNAAGSMVPARLILSTQIAIPVAQRTPSDHLAVLIQAIQSNMPFSPRILLDTGLLPIDKDFTGKNAPGVQPKDYLFSWGTASPQTGRAALVSLLSISKTTYDWQVACQIGINSAGECTLSLRPTMVSITAKSGKQVLKELRFDRGRPDVLPPPEPPQ